MDIDIWILERLGRCGVYGERREEEALVALR